MHVCTSLENLGYLETKTKIELVVYLLHFKNYIPLLRAIITYRYCEQLLHTESNINHNNMIVVINSNSYIKFRGRRHLMSFKIYVTLKTG